MTDTCFQLLLLPLPPVARLFRINNCLWGFSPLSPLLKAWRKRKYILRRFTKLLHCQHTGVECSLSKHLSAPLFVLTDWKHTFVPPARRNANTVDRFPAEKDKKSGEILFTPCLLHIPVSAEVSLGFSKSTAAARRLNFMRLSSCVGSQVISNISPAPDS